MTIFEFSKFVFLASIKLSWNQRTYLYSGESGLSIDIHFVDLGSLAYCTINHPHPYIEIATAISDKFKAEKVKCTNFR